MALSTTYKGYTIEYSEMSDNWVVGSPRMEAKTLSALKTKIDAVEKSERKLGQGIKCLLPDRYSSASFAYVHATLLDVNGSAVWVRTQDGSRSKVGAHQLIKDTEENQTAMGEYNRITREVAALQKQASSILCNLKVYSYDELRDIARLESKPE